MMSKHYLQSKYGITVHYSSRHHNYYSVWLYVTKSDSEFKGTQIYATEVNLELS